MNASGCKTRFASTQIARRVRIIALWLIIRAYANTRKEVIAMLKVCIDCIVPEDFYCANGERRGGGEDG